MYVKPETFTLIMALLFVDVSTIREYSMDEHCGELVSLILEDKYQIKITLDDYGSPGRECVMEVESWYTFPRLMVRLTDLQLNCSHGNLQLLQGSTGQTRVEDSSPSICGDSAINEIYTVTEGPLRLKYTRLTSGVSLDVMEMIVTAFSTDSDHDCPTTGFKCSNGRCIDNNLRCNGYNSCGDMSDCQASVSTALIAGIVIGSLVGLFVLLLAAGYIFCRCRKARDNKYQESDNNHQSHLQFVPGKTGPDTAVHRPGFMGQAVSTVCHNDPHDHDSVEYSRTLTGAKQPAYLPPWIETRKATTVNASPDSENMENHVKDGYFESEVYDGDIDTQDNSIPSQPCATVADDEESSPNPS